MMHSAWTVLLIGGSSATGKSYLARQLAQHYQSPLTEMDDIRIALQQVVDRDKHPDLFYFLEHPDYLRTSEISHLVRKLLDVAGVVWPALNELISKHIVCHEAVIFEGDSIAPSLLAHRDLRGVKAIFLVDSQAHLLEREVQRGRGRGRDSEEGTELQAEFSFQFGAALEAQAKVHQFAVIQAWPLETLFERVITVLEQENGDAESS